MPPQVLRVFIILVTIAVVFFIQALPTAYFSPENIFSITKSRLQIPNDVLFTRLSTLRPTGLTSADAALRSRIVSTESKLLYFKFGPDVIRDCTFCNTEDPNSYLYYALPAILAPHLFNLCVLALVTSGLFAGKEGAVWRTPATIAAMAIGLTEVYVVSSYNHLDNGRATRLEDIDAFFWKMRIYRCLALAALDGVFAWLLFLSSTNRAFLNPPSAAERVETSIRILEAAKVKVGHVSIIQNTIERDQELKAQNHHFWMQESQAMGAIMEEKEVVDGVNDALENRIDMATVLTEAKGYASGIVEAFQR